MNGKLEVWYRGQRWNGSKPEPVKLGTVNTEAEVAGAVLSAGGGMCEVRGKGVHLQGCYFDPSTSPSKSCDALRDILAILQDNDQWDPDPAGCLAQAVKAGIEAVKHDLEKGW